MLIFVTAKIFRNFDAAHYSVKQAEGNIGNTSTLLSLKKITGGFNGGLINETTLKSLSYRKDFLFPFSLLLINTRPVGRQVLKCCDMLIGTVFSTLTLSCMYFRTLYNF